MGQIKRLSAREIEAILANTCDYETMGLNRGLKTDSKLWTRKSAGQPTWNLLQTDSYGYHGDFDCLTSASHGDGLANPYQEWSCDAAGNRNDVVRDHLNRAVSSGGYLCVNDIPGNRLSKGSETYTWDALKRMTSYIGTGPMVSYPCQADGKFRRARRGFLMIAVILGHRELGMSLLGTAIGAARRKKGAYRLVEQLSQRAQSGL